MMPPPGSLLSRLVLVLALSSFFAHAQLPRQNRPGGWPNDNSGSIPDASMPGHSPTMGNNARGGENTLTVHVLGAGGMDLPRLVHVELKLDAADNNFYRDGYLDSSGHYSFTTIPDGSYRVTITAPGFLPQFASINLSHADRQELTLELNAGPDTVDYSPDAGSVSVEWLAVPEKARKSYQKAGEHYAKQDFDGAVKELKRALSIDSNFSYAYNQLGLCYWNLQKYPDAKEAFERAMSTDPKNLQAPLNYAEMLTSQKQYVEAARVLEQASNKHPERGEPYYLMGKLHFLAGNLDRAEGACLEALKHDVTRTPEVHIVLSNIYIRKQDAAKVEAELRAYLNAAPQGHYAKVARTNLDKLKQEQVKAVGAVPANSAAPATAAGDSGGRPGDSAPRQ